MGYATIQDVLTSVQFPLYFLILLFVAKLLATSLTLGSGASAGVFSPALFLGATAGGAYGLLLHRLFPGLGVAAPAFAVVGIGGVVGGATGAALAAIVMIFEMTLDYTVIIPLTLTVAISYAIRKVGSSFGSSMGQLLRLPAWQKVHQLAPQRCLPMPVSVCR